MIQFIKKAKTTTWVAFIVHLFLFSSIAYAGIQISGYHWRALLVAIIPPCIFLYQNIKDYDTTRNTRTE